MVDKGVKPEDYRFQRVDAIVGAILAAFVAMSIIVATGAAVEIDIFGQWVPGEVSPEPLYDPAGERVRG